MIKELIHDPILLSIKSEVTTKEDLQVAQDLLDTLVAHKDGCVGMAANMIGVQKRIIAFDNDGTYIGNHKEIGPLRCRRRLSFSAWRTSKVQTLSYYKSAVADCRISDPYQNLHWFPFTDTSA